MKKEREMSLVSLADMSFLSLYRSYESSPSGSNMQSMLIEAMDGSNPNIGECLIVLRARPEDHVLEAIMVRKILKCNAPLAAWISIAMEEAGKDSALEHAALYKVAGMLSDADECLAYCKGTERGSKLENLLLNHLSSCDRPIYWWTKVRDEARPGCGLETLALLKIYHSKPSDRDMLIANQDALIRGGLGIEASQEYMGRGLTCDDWLEIWDSLLYSGRLHCFERWLSKIRPLGYMKQLRLNAGWHLAKSDMTFDQAIRFCSMIEYDPGLFDVTIEKAFAKARGYDDWLIIHSVLPKDSGYADIVVAEMASAASSFEERLVARSLVADHCELSDRLDVEMRAEAKTLLEHALAYRCAARKNETFAIVSEAMSRDRHSSGEWLSAARQLPITDPMFRFCIKMAVKSLFGKKVIPDNAGVRQAEPVLGD